MAASDDELTPEQEELQRARAQLERAEADFDSFRRRARSEADRAYNKGRDEAASELLSLVDDCDRALELVSADTDADQVAYGVKQMRERALRHFAALGYEPVGDIGETFDPHSHEAVSVEPGSGTDGTILRVHRRGWRRGDELVRAAMVTVLQGSTGPAPDPQPAYEPAGEQSDGRRKRRSRRRRTAAQAPATDYVCPYGIAGCQQDCPGCAPLPPDPFEAALGDSNLTPDDPFDSVGDSASDHPFTEPPTEPEV